MTPFPKSEILRFVADIIERHQLDVISVSLYDWQVDGIVGQYRLIHQIDGIQVHVVHQMPVVTVQHET